MKYNSRADECLLMVLFIGQDSYDLRHLLNQNSFHTFRNCQNEKIQRHSLLIDHCITCKTYTTISTEHDCLTIPSSREIDLHSVPRKREPLDSFHRSAQFPMLSAHESYYGTTTATPDHTDKQPHQTRSILNHADRDRYFPCQIDPSAADGEALSSLARHHRHHKIISLSQVQCDLKELLKVA